jgi:hypothetical protein
MVFVMLRHDTTKISMHLHLPSFNRHDMQWQVQRQKHSLLSVPATLFLSFAVGDVLVWIRACENHKRISCRVVWCCIMWTDPNTAVADYPLHTCTPKRQLLLFSTDCLTITFEVSVGRQSHMRTRWTAGYGLDGRGINARLHAGVNDLSLLQNVRTGPGTHKATHLLGTGGSLPEGKAARSWK